jgi:HEAT repeat protein
MKCLSDQWRTYLLVACAAFGLIVTSCRREPAQAPKKATEPAKVEAEAKSGDVKTTPAPTTESSDAKSTPAPAETAQAAAKPAVPPAQPSSEATDEDAALKAATTTTGNEQYDAIDDLGEEHESAATVVPALEKLLASSDAHVRWHSARSLGDYGEQAKSAVPALRKLLDDPDPIVRYHAIVTLGKIGDKSDATIDLLVTAVTNKDGRIARAAVASLRALKPDPERAMAALENALSSDDSAVTTYAMEAAVERGAQAVPMLNAALKRPKTCYLACAAIEAIGPPAADTVPAIVELLGKTKHSRMEIQALLALASIGPAAKSASPQIIPLLGHETDATVPVAAAFALGSIGASDADEALKQASAKEDNPFLQMMSAWALAKIHPDDEALVKQAVDRLTKGLTSNEAHIRAAAARGLEMLKAPPELVGPALLAVSKEPDPEVEANVVSALASLGEKIIPKASEALQKPEFQDLAVKVLTKMGPKASGAVGAITDAIENATPEFRTKLQIALGAIGPASAPATGILAESLSSPEDGVRESALYALRQIGPGAKDAIPALLVVADGNDAFEALAAAWAVSAIDPTNADAAAKVVPVLMRGLSDNNERNQLESAISLGELGAAAKPAMDELNKTAHDGVGPAVREAAADALKSISGGQ